MPRHVICPQGFRQIGQHETSFVCHPRESAWSLTKNSCPFHDAPRELTGHKAGHPHSNARSFAEFWNPCRSLASPFMCHYCKCFSQVTKGRRVVHIFHHSLQKGEKSIMAGQHVTFVAVHTAQYFRRSIIEHGWYSNAIL